MSLFCTIFVAYKTQNMSKGTYYGPGNRGLATVIQDNSLIPLMQYADQQNQRQEQAKAKQIQDQRAANTKYLDDALKYNPEVVYRDYVDSFTKDVNQFKSDAAQLYKYDSVPTEEQRAGLAQRQALIEAKKNKINLLKAEVDKTYDRLKNDKEVNQDVALQSLRGAIYDDNGDLIDIDNVSPDAVSEIWSKADTYNETEVFARLAGKVEETVAAEIKNLGPENDEREVKFKFYALDKNNNIDYHPDTGEIKYNITPELIRLIEGDERGGIILKSKVEMLRQENPDATIAELKREAAESLLAPHAYMKEKMNRKNRSSSATRSAEENSAGQKWFKVLHDTVLGNSDDAIAQIVDGRTILDAAFNDDRTVIELQVRTRNPLGHETTTPRSIRVSTPEEKRRALQIITSLRHSGQSGVKMKDYVQDKMEELDSTHGESWYSPDGWWNNIVEDPKEDPMERPPISIPKPQRSSKQEPTKEKVTFDPNSPI
jgi:hypothetical protein